jgi:hypothetical protein
MGRASQAAAIVVVVAVIFAAGYYIGSNGTSKEVRMGVLYGQIYTQLGLNSSLNVSQLNATDKELFCGAVETQLANEKTRLNYCSKDSDCAFGIPAGASKPTEKTYKCGIYYNRYADLTALLVADSVHAGSGCDRQASLDCGPLTGMELKCTGGKCEHKLTAQNGTANETCPSGYEYGIAAYTNTTPPQPIYGCITYLGAQYNGTALDGPCMLRPECGDDVCGRDCRTAGTCTNGTWAACAVEDTQSCPQDCTNQASCNASEKFGCREITQGAAYDYSNPPPLVCGCIPVSCPPGMFIVTSGDQGTWPDGSPKGIFVCSDSAPPSAAS